VERSSLSEPMPRYICDKCKKGRVIGSFWMCKSRIFRGICNDCFRARSSGTIIFNCDEDHEYLEIPGKDWKIIGKGEVNAEHLTLGDWIANQKQAYGVLSSEGFPPLPSQRTAKRKEPHGGFGLSNSPYEE